MYNHQLTGGIKVYGHQLTRSPLNVKNYKKTAENANPYKPVADILFSYLRDVIYKPSAASLNIERLPEAFGDFAKGLQYFCNCFSETRAFAEKLAAGNLDCAPPSGCNEIASSLKMLHSSLKHLTWQTQQVAKGDYDQRVDFMGDFSEAFNNMTEELARSHKKLKALSVTDELTKLNNRRSLLEYMDIIWKQNHRLNLPVTVLMIDVDYFKKYNDSLGHLEGDKALIAIAQCMKNHAKRETDFVARFGGEEFVCLLPFIEKDEAVDFAKTLVAHVENMQIPHPMSGHSRYLTISVGMASAVPDENNSQTQLLDEADKALYRAKESGRNRVVIN